MRPSLQALGASAADSLSHGRADWEVRTVSLADCGQATSMRFQNDATR
jgi:hypothetical protein